MSVISITVTPSDRQLVNGIPQFISITTNISSIIFYTLDGQDPDTSSSVYIDSVEMPRDKSYVNLKVFATNGVDSSAILSVVYKTVLSNTRSPQATVTFFEPYQTYNQLIGGTLSNIKVKYKNTSPKLGVNLADVPDTWQDGYDWQGNFGVLKSDTAPKFSDTKLSDSDWQGNRGRGIGNLPQNDIIYLPPDPEQTQLASKKFNPRAMVLFSDSREDSDIAMIFRPSYWDVDNETNRIGAFYETFNSDGNRLISGSFIRQFYNPKNNTITYYYRDSLTNRWIISTEEMPRIPSNPQNEHLFRIRTMNQKGVGLVYRWILFKGTSII